MPSSADIKLLKSIRHHIQELIPREVNGVMRVPTLAQQIVVIKQISRDISLMSQRRQSVRATDHRLWLYFEHLDQIFRDRDNARFRQVVTREATDIRKEVCSLINVIDAWLAIPEESEEKPKPINLQNLFPRTINLMSFVIDISKLNLIHFYLLHATKTTPQKNPKNEEKKAANIQLSLKLENVLRPSDRFNLLLRALHIVGESCKEFSAEFKEHFKSYAELFRTLSALRDSLGHQTDLGYRHVALALHQIRENPVDLAKRVNELSTCLEIFDDEVMTFKTHWAQRRKPYINIEIDPSRLNRTTEYRAERYESLRTFLALLLTNQHIELASVFGRNNTIYHGFERMKESIRQLGEFRNHLVTHEVPFDLAHETGAAKIRFACEYHLVNVGQTAKDVLIAYLTRQELLLAYKKEDADDTPKYPRLIQSLTNFENIRGELMHQFHRMVRGVPKVVEDITVFFSLAIDSYGALVSAEFIIASMLEYKLHLSYHTNKKQKVQTGLEDKEKTRDTLLQQLEIARQELKATTDEQQQLAKEAAIKLLTDKLDSNAKTIKRLTEELKNASDNLNLSQKDLDEKNKRKKPVNLNDMQIAVQTTTRALFTASQANTVNRFFSNRIRHASSEDVPALQEACLQNHARVSLVFSQVVDTTRQSGATSSTSRMT